MEKETLEKYSQLINYIKKYKKPLIALSGGLDSSFLTYAVKESGVRGETVTLSSVLFSDMEINRAQAVSLQFGFRNNRIDRGRDHLDIIKNNPENRCYICKKNNFLFLKEYALKNGFDAIFDGTTFDDGFSYRPGIKALEELGIISPIKIAGLYKSEIRQLCKEFNLDFYNMPSFSCYATRFPYGENLTGKKISLVSEAEDYLRKNGLKQVRVRYHNNIARIEIYIEDFQNFTNDSFRKKVVEKLLDLGFNYVTIDLEGFRSGSMDIKLNSGVTNE